MRVICFGLIAMLAAGASCAPGAEKDTRMPFMPLEIFVAGRGKDTNAGTPDKPFATLERARQEVRRLRKDPSFSKSGITVWIFGGRYERTETFRLGPEDSGSKNAPVVWRACDGQEVRLSGGRRLPSSAFRPVTDQAILRRLPQIARGKVLMIDLKALGISDFGTLRPRGFGHSFTTSALELFVDDKPMTLARWPNEGFTLTGKVIDTGAKVVQPGSVRPKEDLGKLRPCFVFPNDRIKRWAKAEDLWVYGYWRWDWADESLPVETVDAEKGQIKLGQAHHYSLKEGKRFYVFNLLEELDSPGEWWLDRKSGILYLWPPRPLKDARVVVSLLDGPIVEMKDCSNVVLRGLTIEAGRGVGVRIEGGADNLVAGCTLRNLGTWAVKIGKVQPAHGVERTHGGRRNGVRSCEITMTGEGGIHLAGGERKTLTPGNNFAVNNHIHHWSRIARTYQAAVNIIGVGNRVAHNHIHDAPHTAVFFWGNDHVVEYNDVHDVCQETADAGAFYIGRDWSMRGNVLRYNYIHQVGRYAGVGTGGFHGTMAIYLDDWASGTLIEGNLIVGAYYGIMVGSGRDNVLKNNIFAKCSKGAISFDARGLGWAGNYFNGKTNTLFDRLKAVAHDHPPYSTRYPKLANILKDEPVLPKGNRFIHNVCVGGRWIVYHNGMTDAVIVQEGNLTSGDVGLVAPDKGDFRLRPGGPAVKAGVKPLPLDKIGQQPDEYLRQPAKP